MNDHSPLISVASLTVSFSQHGIRQAVVDDVSFAIGAGETFALVGESGSGKSITALSVLRLLPQGANIEAGSVNLSGVDLLRCPESAMQRVRGRRVGIIFQDPLSALNPVLTIGAQIRETLRRQAGLTGRAARERIQELLDQVGLPDPRRHFDEYPHQLSGGMRQRAMIAMALAGQPELLIADEPTTALDVTVQAQILELLKRLQRENGLALWLITHDFGVVAEMAERVAVMRAGKLVEQSTADEFFRRPRERYSQELLAALPRLETKRDDQPSAPPLLEVTNLSVQFPLTSGWRFSAKPMLRAVDDVSLRIGRGETLALVGESGCGKTTLGKAILGLLPTAGGQIQFGGDRQNDAQPQEKGVARQTMQIVFQDPFSSMNPRMIVGDIIAEGLDVFRPNLSHQERRERVEHLLESVGLPGDSRLRYPHEFSGGQRQRICIARALAVEPQLIVCDEPTSALDVTVQAQILRLLEDLRDRLGLSYLFVTHDLAVVAQLADRVAVMRKGRIVESGPTRQVLENPTEAYTRRLLDAVPKLRRGPNRPTRAL